MTIEAIVLLLHPPHTEHCVHFGAFPLGGKCSGKSKKEQGLGRFCVWRKPDRAGPHSLWKRGLEGVQEQAKWLCWTSQVTQTQCRDLQPPGGWRCQGDVPAPEPALPGVTVTLELQWALVCSLADSCCAVPAAGPLISIVWGGKLGSLILMAWLDIKYFVTKPTNNGMSLSDGGENSGCNLWGENSSVS